MHLRKRYIKSIILIIHVLLTITAHAKDGRLYTSEQLSSSSVRNICQDRYGYIWIGTDFGLNRFDGYHFINYVHSRKETKRYRNFELHLKYKVVAKDNNYNGGVQFRSIPSSDPDKPYEMVGYQADIISWKKGALYDESRRWTFLGMPTGAPTDYKEEAWNDYVIRCEGPRVRIWLNGVKTTDYIEPFTQMPYKGIGAIAQDGYIALQIHEGKACEVWYKDIFIKELDLER